MRAVPRSAAFAAPGSCGLARSSLASLGARISWRSNSAPMVGLYSSPAIGVSMPARFCSDDEKDGAEAAINALESQENIHLTLFDVANVGSNISDKKFKEMEGDIRAECIKAQLKFVQEEKFATIIIIGGPDNSGKHEFVNTLSRWFDPRWLEIKSFWDPTQTEKERPPFWKFWNNLPPKGRIGVFFGSWYTKPLVDVANGTMTDAEQDHWLQTIKDTEEMLTKEGVLIIKLWMSITAEEQDRRVQELAKTPKSSWRTIPLGLKDHSLDGKFRDVAERVIRETSTGTNPWNIINAQNDNWKSIQAGRIILEQMKAQYKTLKLAQKNRKAETKTLLETWKKNAPKRDSFLETVPLAPKIDKETYEEELKHWQEVLGSANWELYKRKVPRLVVLEGWDAAGKGGGLRRVTAALDPRFYDVSSIAAPTTEEAKHTYLWRFWREIPRPGYVRVLDRSYYGRLLVERVEGFAAPDEWQRAYREINEFEEHLVESGVLISKFFLHISKEEQLKRFKEREVVARKQHKITDEDWRNRGRWPEYVDALDDMFQYTSTDLSRWNIIASNQKKFARVQLVKTIAQDWQAKVEELKAEEK